MNESLRQNSTSLRLKLLPSFHQHAEVCLVPCEEGTAVSVWIQGEYIEPHPLPDRGPDFTEEALAPGASFAKAVSAFERSRKAKIDKEWRGIVLDGMSVECALVSKGQIVELNEHAWRPGMDAVVNAVIEIAWHSCQDPRVKNALAACAGVNDVTYPMLPVTAKPHRTHVMLLGEPPDKEALRQALSSAPSVT